MHHHTAYGLTIRSNRPLDELPAVHRAASVDLEVIWEDVPRPHPTEREWFRSWGDASGTPRLRAARHGAGGYILRVGEGVEYEIAPDAATIRCRITPSSSRGVVVGTLLDQVVPLALSQRGAAVFHGSAVDVDGAAAAFLGVSGRGKSTLAAHFGRRGHRVVSDDCLVVDDDDGNLRAHPSYPGVRLWSDSMDAIATGVAALTAAPLESNKWRYGAEGALPFTSDALPLGPVFILDDAAVTRLEVSRLQGAALLQAVIRCQFLLDHTDPTELDRSFAAAGRLAGAVPCSLLSVPRDLARLDEHVETILDLVRA